MLYLGFGRKDIDGVFPIAAVSLYQLLHKTGDPPSYMEPMSHPSYAVSAPWEACLISATSLSINVMCIIGTLDRGRCDSLWRSSPIFIDLARNATGYPQLDGLLTFRFAYIVTETMALMRHHRLGVTP